jgi:hypothetical protein
MYSIATNELWTDCDKVNLRINTDGSVFFVGKDSKILFREIDAIIDEMQSQCGCRPELLVISEFIIKAYFLSMKEGDTYKGIKINITPHIDTKVKAYACMDK